MDNNQPEISIIVPVYKVEAYLSRLVDSLINQKHQSFEIILVDDGSPDSCGEICDAYAEKDGRITVIHKQNGGVSSARNAGLDKAKGKFICFADSDDETEQNYLSGLISAEPADLVIAGVKYFEQSGDELKNAGSVQNNPEHFSSEVFTAKIPELLEKRSLNYIYSKLYRRDIIENNNLKFREDMKLGEDTVFAAEYLGLCKSVTLISDTAYHYIKQRNDSLTASFDPHQYEKYITLNSAIRTSLEHSGYYSPEAGRIIDERLIISAVWSTESIFFNSSLNRKKRCELMENVITSPAFCEAFARQRGNFRRFPFDDMEAGSGNKLFKAYLKESGEISASDTYRLLQKLTPERLKGWLRKCRRK